MEERLKRLVAELSLAINDSISASEQVSGVAVQIQESGYEVSLFLNATIGIVKRDERARELAGPHKRQTRIRVWDRLRC